jgi:nitric oxide reductase subunit B
MRNYKRLWLVLGLVIAGSFAILGYFGREIYRKAPPIPDKVVSTDGQVLFTGEDIRDGQNVWQSIGGQEIGTVWGHGAYVAPDWSADWLHRESLWLLNRWSQAESGVSYSKLDDSKKLALRGKLQSEIRTNTYNPVTHVLSLSQDRAAAFESLGRYYAELFGDSVTFETDLSAISDGGLPPAKLRDAYAIPPNTIKDPERQSKMNAFFFWAAWACGTERPGQATTTEELDTRPVTYTNNWPPEPLIANRPAAPVVVWSLISIVVLLAGIGAMVWYNAYLKKLEEPNPAYPSSDPLLSLQLTPSMKATLKYFWVVVALFVLQVALGAVTAHYGVEGQGFFGFPLAKYLPYSVVRTWHIQLGIFWIATAWLATGLFIAPAVAGAEPPFQRAGVNVLLIALVIIVAGTLFGTWYATRQTMSLTANFWFGHQGYEYVDLGRFWQIFLFIGLFLWMGLMLRALWPVLRKKGEQRPLLGLFVFATAAIGLFYGAGLMWGQRTNLAVAEYWRWWVIHLWVEGFFEVFATVAMAFILTRMGLVRVATATAGSLGAAAIYLAGGIVGTFHHLYFTGTPTSVMALGSVFSALEVVPLTLMGVEAVETLRLSRVRPWVSSYRWALYFFVGVAFWNLVGAGLFGFLINPPISLYYVQGLNTTPVHAHTALFGVYGLLGLGLTLFCLKAMSMQRVWKTGALSFSFWAMNIGLVLMVLLSLLPVGLLQAVASINHGMWYARSAEFLQGDFMSTLRWLRIVGDTIFALGTLAFTWFVAGLKTGWSFSERAAFASEGAIPVAD